MLSSLLRNHLLSFRPELTRAPPATVGGLGPCRRWRNSNADTGSGVVSRYRKPTQGNHYLPTAIYGHSWRPQFVGRRAQLPPISESGANICSELWASRFESID